MVAGRCRAIEHDLVDGFAVDGQVQRFSDARILSERTLGAFAVRDVEGHAHVAEVGPRRELQRLVRLDVLDVGRQQPLGGGRAAQT